MKATIESQEGDICHIKLSGEVIQRHLRKFNDPLEASGLDSYKQRVLCDMSETTLLDSAGVSWILVRHKRCCEAGGRFVLHSIPPLVMNVILVLRLDLVFDIAGDEKTAFQLANQPTAEEPRGKVSYNPELAEREEPIDEEDAST